MLGLEKYANKRICVAFSGGADSTALLHYLTARQKQFGYTISAVHCEHGIRGEESLLDKAFVEAVCARWEIPLFSFSEDCPARAKREKESLETAARRFRYECFSSLVAENKTDYIATAHHLDDEAETVFIMGSSKMPLSLYGGTDYKDGKERELIETLPAKDEQEDWLDRMLLRGAIEGLSERDRKIIVLRYFRDMTQSEVAKKIGVSQEQVSRIETRMLKEFKDKLSG